MDWQLLMDLLVGLIAGTISGLLGVGGGIVMTPVLHFGAGLSWPHAVALSLFVIAVQSPIGVWRHARKGAVDWRMAAWLIAGGALGVAIGHWALPRLPVDGLRLAFAGLLVLGAWRMGKGVEPTDAKPTPVVLVAIGLGAGVVSRLLGVGGGIITVPILGLLGIPVHLAVGTSLVPVFTNAALASGANLASGLDWMTGIPLAIGAIGGAFLGVKLAHVLPEQGLRRVVSWAMVAVAVAIVVRTVA